MKFFALIPAYTHIDDRLQDALGRAGVPYHAVYRSSDLPRARSVLLTQGLDQTQADAFLLIDSDIVPTPAQIAQLMASDRLTELDAVSGAYALRDGRSAFVPVDLDQTVMLGQPGFTELASAGLGFAAIHRTALLAIAERLPRITNTGPAWWPFCIPGYVHQTDGTAHYLPDDYVLWARHRDMGGSLWLDQELCVAHCFAEPRRPVPGPVTRD